MSEDLIWLLGFVEDALSIGRRRKQAEEISVLAELVRDPHASVRIPERSRKLVDSLETIRRSLAVASSKAATSERLTTYRVEYGTQPTRPKGSSPSVAENSGAVPGSSIAARNPPAANTLPEAQAGHSPGREPAIAAPPHPDPGVTAGDAGRPAAGELRQPDATGAVIELCDWLDRAREDGICPGRGIEVATQKAGSVLAALELFRIDHRGAFDATEQQIVDCIATDSPEAHMNVCQTVQCGYRAKDRLIRPQRVMVYQFAAAPEPDGCSAEKEKTL